MTVEFRAKIYGRNSPGSENRTRRVVLFVLGTTGRDDTLLALWVAPTSRLKNVFSARSATGTPTFHTRPRALRPFLKRILGTERCYAVYSSYQEKVLKIRRHQRWPNNEIRQICLNDFYSDFILFLLRLGDGYKTGELLLIAPKG